MDLGAPVNVEIPADGSPGNSGGAWFFHRNAFIRRTFADFTFPQQAVSIVLWYKSSPGSDRGTLRLSYATEGKPFVSILNAHDPVRRSERLFLPVPPLCLWLALRLDCFLIGDSENPGTIVIRTPSSDLEVQVGAASQYNTGHSVADGSWHHIAVTTSAGTLYW